MADTKKIIKRQMFPMLTLRGLTVFPYMTMNLDVGRVKSIKAIEEAMRRNQFIFLVTQKDAANEAPSPEELYRVGTVSRIRQILRLPGDAVRVLVEGVSRAEIAEFVQEEPFYVVEVCEKLYINENSNPRESEALLRNMISTFEEYLSLNTKMNPEILPGLEGIKEPSELCDVIAGNIMLSVEDKQAILSEFDTKCRMEKLIACLIKEIEILELEKNISTKVKQQIDKVQREYYLKEQMKVIQDELGDKDGVAGEVKEFREKFDKIDLPEEVRTKVNKELDRLIKMQAGSAEGSVIRGYLECILELPWDKKTDDYIDLVHAKEILDEDHYGLEKVKDRIIEFLAVRKMTNSLNGPILCLYGPPGVGKTSIAKSIARAMNRNYVRVSLGGVRDEAEIRGHRKTYIGSMPGRILNAMKQAGSKNPLILLDEIDKMSSDFKGDPASAMLEVLDAEQNFAFRDHYLELPFDLSQVMFITTANNLDTIPRPLLDRMEVITLSTYTDEEKVNIASKHLLPKQIEKHGLKKSNISLPNSVLKQIIDEYTREAGVRTLEREIATICRKVARKILEEGVSHVAITTNNLEDYLGPIKVKHDKINSKDEIGIVTGLAWTQVGGEILSIEVNTMPGTGKLELTGQLGDVMKESAKAGMSYIRSISDKIDVDNEFYKNTDIHIHIPEGATPKDGPSAGITMATALISALTGVPVKRDVAMTGEITLRGRVLPIGGLKEKIFAAFNAGVKTVIIPKDNEKDIEEIPEKIRSKLKFVPVTKMEEVLKIALTENIFSGKTRMKPMLEIDSTMEYHQVAEQ
ncbi:MAG: endopeptidase La [Clostridia bacterium]|nr:endopeptidase La [Clostridia bacterium]